MKVISVQECRDNETGTLYGWWHNNLIETDEDSRLHDNKPIGDQVLTFRIFPGVQRSIEFFTEDRLQI